nr:MAG TPA: hypothetical protein [Caudoviricetes sp.]
MPLNHLLFFFNFFFETTIILSTIFTLMLHTNFCFHMFFLL